MLPDVQVARLAAEQHGVVSAAELGRCGLDATAVAVRVRSGRLHRLHRGVYAVGHPSVPCEGQFLAAVKACGPGAVLSHLAAAAHWGMLEWEEGAIDVMVPGLGTRSHRGIRVHLTSWLERRDWIEHAGVPVTQPARTLLDLAARLRPAVARRIVRQAQSLGLVSIRQLADVVARAGPRRGVRRLRQFVLEGPVPTRSELEDVVLALIIDAGFARPEINRPLIVGGRRIVPDFRWPEQRLIVEADGSAWHENRIAREDDAERQALLEAAGERLVRVSWQQAVRRRRETQARIAAAGAPTQSEIRVVEPEAR